MAGPALRGPRDIAAGLRGMSVAADLDFSGYRSSEVLSAATWKTFIEVYLEDFTSCPLYPGLGRFVVATTWQFGDWYSIEPVGFAPRPAEAQQPRLPQVAR